MQPIRGIALMILAMTLFVVMSGLIKAADRVPAGEALFFRAAASLPFIAGWLVLRGTFLRDLRTSNWKGHIWRGIFGTTAMGLTFAGLKLLPLPEVTALQFATPLLIVIFAAVLLGERLRLIRLSAVTVGLVGVLIIMWPRLNFQAAGGSALDAGLLGVAIMLASAVFSAFAQIFIKTMAGAERTIAIVFYFSLTATLLSFLNLPWGWVRPTAWEATLLITAGMVGGVGQILLTSAYRDADASVLAPFTYVSMIWSLLIGYLVFAEVPTLQMLGGAVLVMGSGLAIVLRERQLGLRRTAQRKLDSKQNW